MRKIRILSRSVSGENAVEASMIEAIDKWQKEHPRCMIVNHNMSFLTVGTPRMFISLEFEDPDGDPAG